MTTQLDNLLDRRREARRWATIDGQPGMISVMLEPTGTFTVRRWLPSPGSQPPFREFGIPVRMTRDEIIEQYGDTGWFGDLEDE